MTAIRISGLLVLLLLLVPGQGAAHATREGTTPADGATVAGSPPVIAIRFGAPVTVTMARLTDAAGAEHPLERADGMAPTTRFEATPPTLPPGRYAVEWRGLAADGHAMDGRFTFEVE